MENRMRIFLFSDLIDPAGAFPGSSSVAWIGRAPFRFRLANLRERTYMMSKAKAPKIPLEGGCQCGGIRYLIETHPLFLAICHCTECRRQSGSAFGMSLAVEPAAFVLLAGALKTFQVRCDSGRIKTCAFCPDCGTRIYHQTENGMSLKAGTLDDTSWLVPDAQYWTKRRQRWLPIPDSIAPFPDDG
jgi:hypothetical protein